MLSDKPFRKEDLDLYLKELAKEFRKRNGKTIPAEITLIGGASILINYGFREMTYDMDAIMDAASSIRDAITIVGDRYSLPHILSLYPQTQALSIFRWHDGLWFETR